MITHASFIQNAFRQQEGRDDAYRRKWPAISVTPKKTPNTHARVFMAPDDLQVIVSSSRF